MAPDLVIEIVSKNDRADDLLLKVTQYLAAGPGRYGFSIPTRASPTAPFLASSKPKSAVPDPGYALEEP